MKKFICIVLAALLVCMCFTGCDLDGSQKISSPGKYHRLPERHANSYSKQFYPKEWQRNIKYLREEQLQELQQILSTN